jgi:2-polyprenyl-3-methyl-5-hydroxy-6-metoxy-1,4-benzoquinol methylase
VKINKKHIKKNSFSRKKWTAVDTFLYKLRSNIALRYIKNGDHLCDLGCGKEGLFLLRVKSKISCGVGLDVEVDKITNNKIMLKKAELNGILPLQSNEFDVVTSLAVLEHLDDSTSFMREAYRIIKDGGLLLLTTPTPAAKPVLELISRVGIANKESIADHKHYFTKKELASIAQDVGFVDVNIKNFQFGFNRLLIAKK